MRQAFAPTGYKTGLLGRADLDFTIGDYNIVSLLVSNVGNYVTYRAIYDRLHYEGFVAGGGADGYRANVRSAIKRIRNRFRAVDPSFDKIENYTSFGYCWRKSAKIDDRPAVVAPGLLGGERTGEEAASGSSRSE